MPYRSPTLQISCAPVKIFGDKKHSKAAKHLFIKAAVSTIGWGTLLFHLFFYI